MATILVASKNFSAIFWTMKPSLRTNFCQLKILCDYIFLGCLMSTAWSTTHAVVKLRQLANSKKLSFPKRSKRSLPKSWKRRSSPKKMRGKTQNTISHEVEAALYPKMFAILAKYLDAHQVEELPQIHYWLRM